MMTHPIRALMVAVSLAATLAACSSATPLPAVDHVDLERFMGDWYVIANIPTRIETEAHNAVESYRLNSDGSIATTFTFRDGGFDGEKKTYTPTGFVMDSESNAVWGMQFIWPIKADYRIVYLEPDYSTTIIGRNQRDYVWLMARQPSISEDKFAELVTKIGEMGYKTSEIRRVPQRW